MTTNKLVYSTLSEDQLLAEIGKELLSGVMGSKPITFQEALTAGKNWFNAVLPTIREKICSNEALYEQFLSSDVEDRNSVIVTLLDSLLMQQFINIPITSLSWLIIKIGISNLCNGYESA